MAEKYHYKCLNCDRTLTTDQQYPDGQWVCTNCRKLKIPIYLTCTVCGKKFPVQFDTYRLKKDKTDWRCRRCNDDYRNSVYQSKSPEEKAKFVESQIARTKAYYANMTDEERAKNKFNRSMGWKKRWEKGTAESSLEAMKEGRAKWWGSLSEEKKIQQWEYMNEGRIEWWNTISDEDKDAYLRIIGLRSKKSWDKLTPEERLARTKPLRDGCKEYWKGLSVDMDKYDEWRAKFSEGYRKYKDSINPHTGNAKPSKIETEFMNQLHLYKINYIFQYPNKNIHPDFHKLFPINPVTKATFVDPIHMWDFVLKTKHGDVLIDLDGSIHMHETYRTVHRYTKVEYSIYEYNKFNDTKRPYQTDGLPAYAIICPDDKLLPTCEVINITTGEKQSFQTFIVYLQGLDDKLIMNELK